MLKIMPTFLNPGGGQSAVNGYDGTISINSSGLFVNGHGNPIQLRGSNMAGLESQSVSQYWPTTNPWGSVGGPGGPSWNNYSSWHPNAVRVPLNPAVFLNLGMGVMAPGSGATTITLTAASSSSTTITTTGATSAMTGKYLVDLSGNYIPTGTTVTYVNSTTLTASTAVTIPNGAVCGLVATSNTAVPAAWYTVSTTAGSTSSTTITVSSATTAMNGNYLVDITGGSTIPSGTTVTYASATTYTTSNAVTIPSGHTLTFQVGGDPSSVYKQKILDVINYCRQIGCYIIFEVHWSAPKFTFNSITNYMGAFDQPMFLNYDTDYPFWTAGTGAGPNDVNGNATTGFVKWLQTNAVNSATGTINDIIFELFNEPYFDQSTVTFNSAINGGGTSQTNVQTMLSGGWASVYRNQYDTQLARGNLGCPNGYCGSSGQPNVPNDQFGLNYWWRVAGYQQILTGIRALGATNVIQVNTYSFTSALSTFSSIYPTDTLSPPQVSCGMHSYQSGTTNYPGTGDTGSGTSTWNTYANNVLNGTSGVGFAVPVLWTEYGNANGTGSGVSAAQPDTYMQTMESYFDSKTKGSVGSFSWQWNNVQVYGYTGTTSWAPTIYGAPITITAGISGTTMTVSATTGTIALGMTISSSNGMIGGSPIDRAVVIAYGTGSGGTGTYTLSLSATLTTGSTLYGSNIVPLNGQGQTEYNWMVNHL